MQSLIRVDNRSECYFFRLPLVSPWPRTESANDFTCLTVAFALLSNLPASDDVLAGTCLLAGADLATGFVAGAVDIALTEAFFAAGLLVLGFFAMMSPPWLPICSISQFEIARNVWRCRFERLPGRP